MERGVKVIGFIVFFNFILNVSFFLSNVHVNLPAALNIFWATSLVPDMMSLLIFVRYYADNLKRQRLPWACMLVIVGELLRLIITLVFTIAGNIQVGRFTLFLTTSILFILAFAYFTGVCKRYA